MEGIKETHTPYTFQNQVLPGSTGKHSFGAYDPLRKV